MKRFRIQLVIAGIVFICGVSLMGLVYILFNKPEVYINPGIVVSAPSPVAMPVQPTWLRSPMFARPGSYSYSTHTMKNQHTSPAMPSYTGGLYMTSGAQVHSIGGGGGNGYGIATTSGGSSGRRIYSTASSVAMPAVSFVALASQREMAPPQATEAPQMARLASGPRRISGPAPPTGSVTPGYEGHQLLEPPVGGAVVPLILFALGYIVYRRKRLAA